MPTINLDKERVLDRIGNVPDDKLSYYISYLGTDLEGITDDEIDVEVFPDRPDMLSEQGFARALETFMGTRSGLVDYDVHESDANVIVDDDVTSVRPYTVCALIKGIDLDEDKLDEIIRFQEKLHVTFGRERDKVAIGVYPLEHITLPITYTARHKDEIAFTPLEADEAMSATTIIDDHPKGKEYGHLIKGDYYPVFLDADDNILSMPPIINSAHVGEVTTATTDLFIECSGHDYDTLHTALKMFCATLSDLGGAIHSMQLTYTDEERTTPEMTPTRRNIDEAYASKILGVPINDVASLLGRMGYGYDGDVLVPPYRADVLHQIDIVEDLAIAHGYDTFDQEIPEVATVAKEDPLERFKSSIRELLIGHGLVETKTYTLSNTSVQNEKMQIDLDTVALKNSLSNEYNVLRTWITPCVLETLSRNTNRTYPQHVFEIGRVLSHGDTATGVTEAFRVATVLCGDDADYTRIRQVLDTIFDAFDIEATYEATEHPSYIEGRAARVYVDDVGVAYIGEIHPAVLENFGIEMPCATFELNLSDLYDIM
jgi:phenylalanyl-tRNA synthetase beta chain